MHAASALPAGRRPPAVATIPDFGHPLGVVGTSPHSLSRAAGLSYSVLSSIPVPVSSRRKPRPPPPLQSAGEPLSPFFTPPLSAQLASTGSSAELGPATMVESSLMVCHRQPTWKSAAHYSACVPAVARQPEQPPRCWAASPGCVRGVSPLPAPAASNSPHSGRAVR